MGISSSSWAGPGAVLLSALALSANVALVAGAQPAQQAPTPVFGEKVEVVSVDVLVLDQAGNPAHGLTQEDFTIKEDGVPQTITSFEAIRFDDSEATDASRERFVTSNTADRVRPERAFLVIYDDVHLTTRGAVGSLEAMKRAVEALGLERGRKAVLLLSEGFFYDSTRTELRELVRAAREANAVLYFFDARGRSGGDRPCARQSLGGSGRGREWSETGWRGAPR